MTMDRNERARRLNSMPPKLIEALLDLVAELGTDDDCGDCYDQGRCAVTTDITEALTQRTWRR